VLRRSAREFRLAQVLCLRVQFRHRRLRSEPKP